MSTDPYLFPTGSIREAEKKLFDANDMERMIDAEDVNQSFKVFNDLSYADELLDMENPEQYKEVLAHDLGQIKNFLKTISPDPQVMEIVLATYDFHNFKVLFKAKLAGKEEAEHTSPLGTVTQEKLTEKILKGNTKIILVDALESLAKEAIKDLEKTENPAVIDSYFDKKYFAYISKKACSLHSEILVSLVKAQIDIANIKIMVRSKLIDRPLEEVKKDLIPEGNITDHSLIASYTKELAGIIKAVQLTFTEPQINTDLEKFLETSELWQLEKALENYLIRFIKESKMGNQGPEVMVAYFLAKKNAIRNIRLIMTGKINNISGKELKERVKELY